MKLLKLPGLVSPYQGGNLKAFDTISPGMASRIVAAQHHPHIGLAITDDGACGAFSIVDNLNYWVNRPGLHPQEQQAFIDELMSANLLFTRDCSFSRDSGWGYIGLHWSRL